MQNVESFNVHQNLGIVNGVKDPREYARLKNSMAIKISSTHLKIILFVIFAVQNERTGEVRIWWGKGPS